MNLFNEIRITEEAPSDYQAVFELYRELGWNSLELATGDLERMCQQSWYVIYAYHGDRLVGMGRIVSDGVITGLICGVGILPSYQRNGIGRKLMNGLVEQCDRHRVIPQLMCSEELEPYYESMGFKKFAAGMTRMRKRK